MGILGRLQASSENSKLAHRPEQQLTRRRLFFTCVFDLSVMGLCYICQHGLSYGFVLWGLVSWARAGKSSGKVLYTRVIKCSSNSLKKCNEADPVAIATINEVLALLTKVNPCNCHKCNEGLAKGGPGPKASALSREPSPDLLALVPLGDALVPPAQTSSPLALVALEDDADFASELQALAVDFAALTKALHSHIYII